MLWITSFILIVIVLYYNYIHDDKCVVCGCKATRYRMKLFSEYPYCDTCEYDESIVYYDTRRMKRIIATIAFVLIIVCAVSFMLYTLHGVK